MEMGRSTPQHIQQLVMREYCKERNMTFLLSAVEYRMPGCTMILDAILADLNSLEGVVMYSLYLFPQSREKRMKMYKQLFENGCALHTAVEGLVIKNWDDAMRVEESLLVGDVMRGQSKTDIDYLTEWELQNGTN